MLWHAIISPAVSAVVFPEAASLGRTTAFSEPMVSYNYIGLVESLEGNDVSARFLRSIRGSSGSEKPTFAFKEKDEASFPLSEVLRKLPQPQKAGGPAKREQQITFPCNLDDSY